MRTLTTSIVLAALLVLGLSGQVAAQAPANGRLTVAFDVSIAPTFLDPAGASGNAIDIGLRKP